MRRGFLNNGSAQRQAATPSPATMPDPDYFPQPAAFVDRSGVRFVLWRELPEIWRRPPSHEAMLAAARGLELLPGDMLTSYVAIALPCTRACNEYQAAHAILCDARDGPDWSEAISLLAIHNMGDFLASFGVVAAVRSAQGVISELGPTACLERIFGSVPAADVAAFTPRHPSEAVLVLTADHLRTASTSSADHRRGSYGSTD